MSHRHAVKIEEINDHVISYPLSVNHSIVITDDGQGIAQALAQQFKSHRYKAEVVSEIPLTSDVVILLNGLTHFQNPIEAMQCNFTAFKQAAAAAKRFSHKKGLFITVQNTGGQFGFSAMGPHQAWSAGLSALAKTAAAEWPNVFCKAIDIEITKRLTPEAIAQRLFREITQGSTKIECGLLANNTRITLATQPQAASPEKSIIDQKSVVVAAGGGRGITAACLIELTKKSQATFILLGRSHLEDVPKQYQIDDETKLRQILFAESKNKGESITPKQINQIIAKIKANREIKHTIEHIQAAGGKAFYYEADIINFTQLQQVFSKIRQKFGKITALIHAAGVIEDKLILEQSEEQFSRVFQTKVVGLHNLLAATEKDNLQFIGLFSSVAARFGNVGQVAYAMGNEVLNKVAQYESQKRGSRCLVKSFNWGPWEMGMVTPELKKLFAERGIALISKQQGIQLFMDEISSRHQPAAVEIVCGSRLTSE